ncbi:MAG: methanogenesis marker 17 protein [Thermoproteota archaeon]|jgi:putative methanogenesis marker protein 17|uniref:Methanogenesis marker 17 protein n=1 Tax=Candidatus Methanodesulfokora washburnensis TaxID=2478471 RepID=A0A3R9RLA7_9CREN|nr:methanogenesis marker 17 protein [Candidatus Methanodesulfokores washburnensis]RSN72796.1 methanogenesis marker 17 protein [Candidatus Methanodesulfokores washburnensis]RZN62173.1 MAG: methanogenesis marker 17 protein [Candidatus Methanodesulfokores washburnensis]TDA40600.1 MAG: methanogenesis marker 17 protein [Candidatus Korarchaeota archaeon]
MNIRVECPDEEAKAAFERTISSVISDSPIKSAIKDIYVYTNPEEPVFILIINYSKPTWKVKLVDAVKMRSTKDGTIVTCENDKYFPGLMRVLWERFGRENTEQLSRYEVMVRGEIHEDVLNSVIFDPEKELAKGLIDVIIRIVPEGFRIRKYIWKEEAVIVISSEDPIKDEWVKMAMNMWEVGSFVHPTPVYRGSLQA